MEPSYLGYPQKDQRLDLKQAHLERSMRSASVCVFAIPQERARGQWPRLPGNAGAIEQDQVCGEWQRHGTAGAQNGPRVEEELSLSAMCCKCYNHSQD